MKVVSQAGENVTSSLFELYVASRIPKQAFGLDCGRACAVRFGCELDLVLGETETGEIVIFRFFLSL